MGNGIIMGMGKPTITQIVGGLPNKTVSTETKTDMVKYAEGSDLLDVVPDPPVRTVTVVIV